MAPGRNSYRCWYSRILEGGEGLQGRRSLSEEPEGNPPPEKRDAACRGLEPWGQQEGVKASLLFP